MPSRSPSPQRLGGHTRGVSLGRTSVSPPPPNDIIHQRQHLRRSSSPSYNSCHAFPYAASESVADLSLLADLIDSRSGWCESQRQSEDQIEEACRGRPRAIRNALRFYYENLNYVLDGMRQADVVVESQFPAEVMRRFGTIEEVQQAKGGHDSNHSHHRNISLSHHHRALPTPGTSTPRRSGHNRSHTQFMHILSQSIASSGAGTRSYSYLPQRNGYSSEEEEGAGHSIDSAAAATDRRRRRPRRRARDGQGRRDLESGTTRKASSSSVLNLSNLWGLTRTTSLNRTPPSEEEESGFDSDSEPEPEGAGPAPGGGRYDERSQLIGRGRRREYGSATGDADKASSSKKEVVPVETPSSKTSTAIIHTLDSDNGKHVVAIEHSTPGSAEGSLDRTLSDRKQEQKVRSEQRREAMLRVQRDKTLSSAPDAAAAIAAGESTSTPHASAAVGVDNDNEAEAEERDRLTALPPGGKRERDRLELRRAVPGWEEQEEGEEKSVQFAININLFVNVLLLAGKGVAVLSSSSVSLLASLVDSALDLLSTLIIFCASKMVAFKSSDSYFKYPRGKKNFEPLGVVIFSVLMIASFVQVLVESCERLRAVTRGESGEGTSQALPWIGIIFMVATIFVKTVMWLLYNKSKSAGVRAVAQDSQNDVVFNIFSLTFPFVGAQMGWPALDPIGGILLSLYIISEWLSTLIEMTTKLSGARASSAELARTLYLITRFKSVKSVSACEMYHAGEDFIVEADIVLPVEMALKQAHDLGELTCYTLEMLPGIERAYVHLDYNSSGIPAHISARG